MSNSLIFWRVARKMKSRSWTRYISHYFIFDFWRVHCSPKMDIFGRNGPFFSLKLAEKQPMVGWTEKSYRRKTRNSGKNRHFWGKCVSARQNYFKQQISGEIDLTDRLQKTLGLQEVTERSHGRKTKDFIFFQENLHFWPESAFFLIRLPENNFFEIKQTKESVRV